MKIDKYSIVTGPGTILITKDDGLAWDFEAMFAGRAEFFFIPDLELAKKFQEIIAGRAFIRKRVEKKAQDLLIKQEGK